MTEGEGAAAGIPGTLGSIATQYTGEALAFGLGFALARVLEPTGTKLRQEAWVNLGGPIHELDAGEAAEVVAERLAAAGWGEAEAALSGIDAERFAHLTRLAETAPGFGELLRMLRRGTIGGDDFAHGLRKARHEERWDAPLEDLQHDRLDPAVVATAIQRGVIADPGVLPVGPPHEVGRIAPMPIADIDAVKEVEAAGLNRERLAALARIVGLPPAPGELLELLNRGHIDTADYLRGIAEGNTRNEWAAALMELRRRILSPHEYAELRLRGWIDDGAMHSGASLSGMAPADTDLLHAMLGRPLPVHQVVTGEARGGKFDGPTGDIPHAFRRSLEEGNIRPEWYDLAYANRYTFPSAFVIRGLLRDGALTRDEGDTLLRQSGWPPHLATAVADAYGKGSATGARALTATQLLTEYEGLYLSRADFVTRLHELGYTQREAGEYAALGDARRVATARTARVNRIRAQYVDHRITLDAAKAALARAELPREAQDLVIEQWQAEREVNVSKLTPAQIKKAYKSALYTRDVALGYLEERAYSPADAATLLDE